MNKKFIIQKNELISEIISTNILKKNNFFVVYSVTNNLDYNRYCITIGKKITNAVNRNKIKRKIKDILMKNSLNYSKDYVIIVRKRVLNISYNELKNELLGIIKEIN